MSHWGMVVGVNDVKNITEIHDLTDIGGLFCLSKITLFGKTPEKRQKTKKTFFIEKEEEA